MASPDLQAKANALNARMEGQAKIAIDEVERTLLRTIARDSYTCVVSCYDKAGTKGPSEQLEHCSRECQAPNQMAHNTVQQEVGQFQNRLNRAMMQCNDDASAMITPDVQGNTRKMKAVEDKVLACMSTTVNHHIESLIPMKKRIASVLGKLSK
mmetsp:Transcript_12609/g.14800  ORF Transcript_12609/g.14800 Transcript_12609/m.14800 type:complete len:154 (+) Transcript_12609:94-555(+)|eukprot:CAMPEP_0198252174 /NCGR_PEP_ID=MMETSP1447-20131203/2738_1 /TAXON_ID=420782 /ORGANISM="Chaetoceros dichaeta, Strain CCMP1751" /LENGTH=153 /DNA_ID=CAMNT_0043937343 /DNA_START=82 /DNA_END=543 /DNA_ORIENTATION=+